MEMNNAKFIKLDKKIVKQCMHWQCVCKYDNPKFVKLDNEIVKLCNYILVQQCNIFTNEV